jgi:type I restriction enzyme S subunit
MFTDQIEETEPYFLNYQYQTATSIKKIADITKGNTIKHILSSDMQKFIVDMPSLEEQRDIASFFRRLDTLITLHQRECDKWQTLKKALLQQMFV